MSPRFYMTFIALLVVLTVLEMMLEGAAPMNFYEVIDWMKGNPSN
jgi:hypothetical protein